MRAMWLLLPCAIVAACSSDDAPECTIPGTYRVLGATESGSCPEPGGDPVTYTIIARGSEYTIEIQGLTGACVGQQTGACKMDGKCDVTITDAVTPGAKGTYQISWVFTDSGFKGSAAISLPDAKSLPGGCSGSYVQTGVRR